MPLDKFKTQVLILHSEQSTLDDLSAGFSDNYTVHCATSGSEALNTLVETPINVLISAQDLPGMSGLDALREARKRSPDMIGILLAGDADSGLEALVGNEELFQIVRGNVTSESLLKLVDEATRQMRLMALTHSANDTTANVDQPSEHIVMETSENGSAIISDGTGRLPALDPEKISAAASVGSRAVDVLVLTKDREFLETVKASARGMHKVFYANTLAQADEAIRKFKIGVGVVDAAMVGGKIEQLTQHLRKGSPRLVCIVAGRRDDGEMLMDLINRGKVYRFLLKPVSPGRARLAIESSVKHHLEAPDAAFKSGGRLAAVKPVSKIKAKPAPKLRQTAQSTTAPKDPPMGSVITAPGQSLIEDGLADAFGQNDSHVADRFKKLVGAIGKKFSSDRSPKPAPARAAAGGWLLQNLKILGVGAVVIVAGALYWTLGDSIEPVEQEALLTGTPLVSEADVVFDMPAADVNDGRDDSDIAAELDVTVDQALSMAEAAMLETQLDAAAAALQKVTAIDADNARLPFLKAQLLQMKLRSRLDSARVAIREDRFEDAATALAAARSLEASDTTEIDAIAGELATARSEQRIDDVLAKAAARVTAGALLTPANDNARYFYELVLTNDPQNSTARQGLNVIASKLALQASASIVSGDLVIADDLLADALAIDPANTEVAQTVTMLASARADIAEKLAAPVELAVKEDDSAEQVEVAATDEPTEVGPPAAEDAASGPPESATVAAATQDPVADVPVAVSSLRRIKYVAPKYPRSALRRNLSGWVDIIFTVATDGTVKEIFVRGSEPGDTFVNAATKAVERWEFEPIVEDGTTIEKRAGVRMMFAF
ncbi:MAG: TonB family protein [Proteobacteria bacterium]|nr:TonB family protein [Pseudomonadota bacterium]